MSNKLTAIILYTDVVRGSKTKQCRSVCNITKKTTVIEQQIRFLKKNNSRIEIFIVAGKGYKEVHKIVKDLKFKNIEIVYEKKYSQLNQSQILIDLINNKKICNNILLILGEILLKNTNFKKLSHTTALVIDKPKEGFDIKCRENDSKAEYFFYDIPNEKQWAEIVFLDKESLYEITNNMPKKISTKQLFIFETLNLLIDQNKNINTQIVEYKNILKIKGDKDINKAKVFIR